LGRLLASAMMTGYFLHKAETRMGLEDHLANLDDEESYNVLKENYIMPSPVLRI
jgi:hypothetical protein